MHSKALPRRGHMSSGLITAGGRAGSTGRAPTQFSTRVRARVHRRVIDREIAAGAAIDTDPARALRAAQLTSEAERRGVAASLWNILQAADERHADPASHLRLNHADVLAARHGVVALIEILRSEQTVAARGVALARLLTAERRSPMLCESSQRSVKDAVCEALAAL
jgi:hypothetical protein